MIMPKCTRVSYMPPMPARKGSVAASNFVIACVGLGLICITGTISCGRKSDAKMPGSGDSHALASGVADRPSSEMDRVGAFLEQWDGRVSVAGAAKGSEMASFLSDVLKSLGEGAALGEFIVGLYDRREIAIVDRLLSEHGKAMFSGKNGAETREWLHGVKDGDFRNRLWFEAGYYFTGPGLKDHFDNLTPEASRERFLTGYASGLAESDPIRAASEYRSLRLGKCTMYGLLEVMDRLNPEGDFSAVDALNADDYDEANNMGAALRQRLLARWASFHPEAAAKYVADTPKRVKPESVRVVIAKWSETKPEDALAWLEKAPAGPLRDAGLEELASLALKAGSPADAWQRAAKVSDFDRKVKLATEVFKEWEKKDQAAAVKAWEELFPPGK